MPNYILLNVGEQIVKGDEWLENRADILVWRDALGAYDVVPENVLYRRLVQNDEDKAIERPDRYSAIRVNVEDDLPALIKAAKKLGLIWMVMNNKGMFDVEATYFYVFFDEKGKQAYLSGALAQ